MTPFDAHFHSRVPDGPAGAQVRRLLLRATGERLRGRHQIADELTQDARALAAAAAQYEWAIATARERLRAVQHDVHCFWERGAADRTLHELADDASLLMALLDDCDRAHSRVLTLEMARP